MRRIPLKAPHATLTSEFVSISSVRELADGRVLVTDNRENQLYVADFQSLLADKLGRKGKGPSEWTRLGDVLASNGDSSMIGDPGNRRWLLLDGTRIVGAVPPDHPAVQAVGRLVTDVDRLGRILVTRRVPSHFVRCVSRAPLPTCSGVTTSSSGPTQRWAKIRSRCRFRDLWMTPRRCAATSTCFAPCLPASQSSRPLGADQLRICRSGAERHERRAPRTPDDALVAFWRDERVAVLSTLIKQCRGDIAAADDALAEAMARAMPAWRTQGIPDRPGAWILTTARRILIDGARRRSAHGTESLDETHMEAPSVVLLPAACADPLRRAGP